MKTLLILTLLYANRHLSRVKLVYNTLQDVRLVHVKSELKWCKYIDRLFHQKCTFVYNIKPYQIFKISNFGIISFNTPV